MAPQEEEYENRGVAAKSIVQGGSTDVGQDPGDGGGSGNIITTPPGLITEPGPPIVVIPPGPVVPGSATRPLTGKAIGMIMSAVHAHYPGQAFCPSCGQLPGLVDLDGDGNNEGRLVDQNGDGSVDTIVVNPDDDDDWDGGITDTNRDGRYDTIWIDEDGDGRPDPGELAHLSEEEARRITELVNAGVTPEEKVASVIVFLFGY